MPNQITENGIEIMSLEEIRDLIINGDDNTPGLRNIFGEDAVFDSDSPDGQLVGIFSQAVRDLEELILQALVVIIMVNYLQQQQRKDKQG